MKPKQLQESDLQDFDHCHDMHAVTQYSDELIGALLNAEMRDFIDQVFETFNDQYADLPYHNREHHRIVANFCMLIADRVCEQSVADDLIKPLILAAGTHDIGYDVDYTALWLPQDWTKEDYSIHLLKEIWTQAGYDPKLIEQATEWIDATKLTNTNFSTPIRKILRAADIRLSWLDYDLFVEFAMKIKAEYEILHNTKLPMPLFATEQMKIMKTFLTDAHKKSVPDAYYALPEWTSFYKGLEENVERFEREFG